MHRPVNGGKGYEVQTSVDPVTGTSWAFKMAAGKSSGSLEGLTSGARLWVRVRAIGADNAFGPWSDPAVKTVP
jgi:predicted secreted protein